jgi:hypothetical protein
MLDRQKVETILLRRFPGARHDAVAAAVNAIMGLNDEWEEVLHEQALSGDTSAPQCPDLSALARDAQEDVEYRLFRRATCRDARPSRG